MDDDLYPVRETSARPPTLTVAYLLLALQGAVVVVLAGLEVGHFTTGRLTMGISTAIFFLAYGVALLACAWGLARVHSWARGPAVLAQLIQLGMAWSFRGGDTTAVAVVLAGVAIVTLLAIFNPASMRALESGPTE